jgi:transcriptional regulator with XRE-family HTH domain
MAWRGPMGAQPGVRLIPDIIRFLGYCPYSPSLSVSGWLKHIRHSLGYSQERMGQVLKIDEGTWRRWENGGEKPAVKYLERFQRVINPVGAPFNPKVGGLIESSHFVIQQISLIEPHRS